MIVVGTTTPSCAAIIAWARDSMNCGRTCTVAIGLQPVQFYAPWAVILCTITIVTRIIAVSPKGWSYGIQVRIDARACVADIYIKLHIPAKQIK